jgi:hypothetical protein
VIAGGAGAAVGLQHVAVEVMVRSPARRDRRTARRLRPIRRWISWVRPFCLPLRGFALAAGVGRARQHAVLGRHPAAALASQAGPRSSMLAVHSTRVSPNATNTEPSAWRVNWRSMLTARS